eukprot:jgi/Botrbrau1/18456/Bobra.0072s0039.1
MDDQEISDEETISAPLSGGESSSEASTEEDEELDKKLALARAPSWGAESRVSESPIPVILPPLQPPPKRSTGTGKGRGRRKKKSDAEDGGGGGEGETAPAGPRRLTARQKAMEARLKEEREGGPKPAFVLLPSAPVLTQEQLLKKEEANARRREIQQKQRRQQNEHTLQRIRGTAGGGTRGHKRGRRKRAAAVAIALAAAGTDGGPAGEGGPEAGEAAALLSERQRASRLRPVCPRLIQRPDSSMLVYPPDCVPPQPFCLAPTAYPLPRLDLGVEWLVENLKAVQEQRLGCRLDLLVDAPNKAWCMNAAGEKLGCVRSGPLQVGSTCKVELRSLSWKAGPQGRVPHGGLLRVLS